MNSNSSEIYQYQKPQDPDGGEGVGGLLLGRRQWAKGRRQWAQRPFLGCQSGTQVGHVSDICPKIVLAWKTMIHLYFRRKMAHGQKVDRSLISRSPEIVQVLSTSRVTRQ